MSQYLPSIGTSTTQPRILAGELIIHFNRRFLSGDGDIRTFAVGIGWGYGARVIANTPAHGKPFGHHAKVNHALTLLAA